MNEPTGVTIHEPHEDRLLHQDRWTVLHQGQTRTLVLRVGRGFLERECAQTPLDEVFGAVGCGP